MLPEFLKGSWNNARKIIKQDDIGPFPFPTTITEEQLFLKQVQQSTQSKSEPQDRNLFAMATIKDISSVLYVLILSLLLIKLASYTILYRHAKPLLEKW